jgi:sortase A
MTSVTSRVLRVMKRARERLPTIVARSSPGFAGAPSPMAGRRWTQTSAFVGGLAVFLGIALLADAVATVVWRDPITSVFAQERQKKLEGELNAIEKTPLPASELALVRNAITKEKRMALLASHLMRQSRAGDPLGRISIPRLDKHFVFVTGTGESSLEKGPGHYLGTALPGLRGTVGIAGHRTTYLAPFRHIDRMRKGDRIVVTMPYGRFSYHVEGTKVIKPTQTSVLRHAGYDRLVLTTCTPLFSNKKRLIVTARLAGSAERGPTIDQTPLPPVAPL